MQARLLTSIARRVVSADLNPIILDQPRDERIDYRLLDAEQVDRGFPPASFDLVFSSSLLEHLPDVDRALAACRAVLVDDGVMIHVVPSPMWKATHLTPHLPDKLVTALDLLLAGGGLAALRDKWAKAATATIPAGGGNNQKTAPRSRSRLARLLAPEPHGVSAGNLEEFAAFDRGRWLRALARAGFEVVAMIDGPVASGHLFGFERLRAALGAMGLSSETAFVTVKRGARAPRLRWFPDQR